MAKTETQFRKNRIDSLCYLSFTINYSFDAVHSDGTTIDIETVISVLVKKNLMSINSVLIAAVVNPSNDRVCQLNRDICYVFNIYYVIIHLSHSFLKSVVQHLNLTDYRKLIAIFELVNFSISVNQRTFLVISAKMGVIINFI